jgi:DNA-binding beta-propeller fold protein YncE
MRARSAVLTTAALSLLAGCGLHHSERNGSHRVTAAAPSTDATRPAELPPRAAEALVTDETENRLLVVALPSGRVSHRVALPAGPEDIAASGGGIVVVVSSRAGKVTMLDRRTLHTIRTFGGFNEPHIAAISPDGRYAYITDDASGTLTAIRLLDMKVTRTIAVGAGAHHLTFSPDGRRVWIALGESATEISIVDTTTPDHPRLLGHFQPGFPAHDLSFSPDGRQVWVTSATGPDVTAFDARDHRVLFHVPVGAPPQHLDLEDRFAYLTSGYGGTIEMVDAANGRMLTRTTAPYGSFELAAARGYVATASLLRGTLAVYTPALRPLRVVRLAPATRELAISQP